MLTRRSLVVGGAAWIGGCALPTCQRSDLAARAHAVRERVGGRLGVHALDTGTGERVGFDDEARYAMASTFKLVLAAAILERCDRGALAIEQRVGLSEADMVEHAPHTSKHLARGWMTVEELCAAIVTVSDNPAANVLLAQLGGPPALTAFLRRHGDPVTRLDRSELELNENAPGDPRDTTTPRAMVDSMRTLLLGSALAPASRERLIGWLIAAESGRARIRAGLPSTFRAGDKTGTGANGAVNDVAIVWPPGRAPWLIALYMSESTRGVGELSAAHAELAALIAERWS